MNKLHQKVFMRHLIQKKQQIAIFESNLPIITALCGFIKASKFPLTGSKFPSMGPKFPLQNLNYH